MEKLKLPAQQFSAEFAASSVNADARTAELTWQTGAQVPRFSWKDGQYMLQLSMDPKHIRMDRLTSGGAPVLNNHSSNSLEDVIGVVESATSNGAVGRATVRFDTSPAASEVFRKVKESILRNVSVGTFVHKLKDVTPENAKTKAFLAVDWEPFEISVVPVGADLGATIDKQAIQTFDCEIEALEVEVSSETRASAHEGEKTMETTTVQTGAEQKQPVENLASAPVDVAKIAREAVIQDRLRCEAIRTNARIAGLDEKFSAELINANLSVEEAGTRIFAAMAEKGAKMETVSHHSASVTADQREKKAVVVASALLSRFAPRDFKLADGAGDYRGMTLLDIAREYVEDRGISTRGMSKDTIAKLALERGSGVERFDGGYQGTTDFPGILADVANKTLRQAYEQTPRTFVGIFRQVSAPDFKSLNRVQLGATPKLDPVGANGTFNKGQLIDSKESYKLGTFGKIVALSRQTIVNDDLDAFSRVPAGFGAQAANLESDTVWGVITANANMSDGNALFSTAHKNLLSSGSAPDVPNLGAMRKVLRQTKDLDGKTLLSVLGKNLVVPAALETNVEQLVSTMIVPQQISNAVPQWYRSLNPIVEPRLDGASTTAYYLFADYGMIDTVEYAYLEGQEGVYLEARTGYDVDGIEIKARLDFAAKAIDWRGMVKNPGA